MLKRILILLVLALAQFGCGYQYGDLYEVESLGDPLRERLEREKREFVQIEDIKIGDGSLASWGRKISAELEIHQADGTFIFKGSAYDLVGFKGMPETSLYDERALNGISNPGIRLGLNGMAVGGKRRITVDRKLICMGIPDDAPLAKCPVIGPGNHGPRYDVLKQRLIVEATLTESCIPVRLWAFVWVIHINKEIYCRVLPEPKLDPTAPTWRYYH
jgi:hypothetical protein